VVVTGASHRARTEAVDMGHTRTSDATTAKTSDTSSAKATDATTAKTSAKATDVAAAKAAHSTTTTVPSASAASGLCAACKQASGQYSACQNHHRSSFHDKSPFACVDGFSATARCLTSVFLHGENANVAIKWR
jgi:hypothetical protein